MDKLVERENAPRSPFAAAPALAVQFFLVPLAVVAVAVGVYVGFRSLIADDRSAQEYLTEVRRGCASRGIDYQLYRTSDPLSVVLSTFLHRRTASKSAAKVRAHV